MTEERSQDEAETSLFVLGTSLLRKRRWIMGCAFLGAMVSALAVFNRPLLYRSTTTFVSQATDLRSEGLVSLAGQFGLTMAQGGQPTQSPQFYLALLRSRTLLLPIVRDTIVVDEMGGEPVPFLELFGLTEGSVSTLEDSGVQVLNEKLTTSLLTNTGILELSVVPPWPRVSLVITTALLDGVNEFNQLTRQTQAASEREFVEARLKLAGTELREAEDALERFLEANRQFSNSAELTFRRGRLDRELMVRQQVFTSLTQAYEEVRIREVRDTPVISVVEQPHFPTRPEPRGRIKSVVIGLLTGGFAGVFMALVSGIVGRRRERGDPEVDEFFEALGEIGVGIRSRFGRSRPS